VTRGGIREAHRLTHVRIAVRVALAERGPLRESLHHLDDARLLSH
jgi:hypothetical protein